MKKLIIVSMLIMVTLTGCQTETEQANSEIVSLRNEIESLKLEKEKLETEVLNEKIEQGSAIYIVSINIAQKHYNVDDIIKDAMNDIDIEIPVSKEFYDSVEIGTVLDNSFRMGSLVMNNSIGTWNITISDKRIE